MQYEAIQAKLKIGLHTQNRFDQKRMRMWDRGITSGQRRHYRQDASKIRNALSSTIQSHNIQEKKGSDVEVVLSHDYVMCNRNNDDTVLGGVHVLHRGN
jgi:hypothetical protein